MPLGGADVCFAGFCIIFTQTVLAAPARGWGEVGVMEMSGVSLPQFPRTGSCSSPREIPGGIPRHYCRSHNKPSVVTRAWGGGDSQPCLSFPAPWARGAP